MSLSCPGLNIGKQHASRYKIGRSGYTGAPIPKAIVLHELADISAETFAQQLCSALPRYLCEPDPVTCAYPYNKNPKGVHFVVTNGYYTQYAELSATTLGLDYINGTWPGLIALQPITDVNGPFVHVALDSSCNCADKLIQLLCCIGVELGLSLPILAASDLQLDRPTITLNPMLQAQVDNCVASGGFLNPPTVFDLEDRVEELELCCATNTSRIIQLESQVTILNGRVLTLEDQMLAAQAKIAELYEKVAIIPALQQQIITLTNLVQDILSRCCPTAGQAQCFNYRLTAGDEMLLTPNQCIWLNLPKKIEDRDNPSCANGCCPPIVSPGPLWMANLSNVENCQSCAVWSLDATVRFRLAQWCAGKKAQLYLVACGVKYLLDEEIITFTGTQQVTLTGSFLLDSGCTDVHLLVCTDDDLITTAKVVEYASFKGCCAS